MDTKKLITLLGFLFLISGVIFAAPKNSSIEELEAKVAELDKMFNVSARKYVSTYFELSDEYYKQKDFDNSYENAVKGLRLDSGNMEMQFRAAEYEINKKKYDLAYPRITFIIEKSEDEKTVESAKKLLKKIPSDSIKEFSKLTVHPKYDKTVLVVFYPGVEEIYKSVICQRIEQEYKVTVKTKEMTAAENEKNLRDGWNKYLTETTESLISQNSGDVVDNTLRALNITRDDLKTKEGKEYFLMNVFFMSGYSEQDWENIKSASNDQYDANSLIAQIKTSTPIDSNCFGILAVTSKDIYSGSETNNFLFGLASKNIAVMSINRFVKFADTKSVAMKRIVMQAFSSMGHVIGIARCSTPLCARAYPNSLEEQDKKNDVLCPTCIKNINAIYEKK